MNRDGIKRTCKNLLIDGVSVLIFLAILYICVQGATTLYGAYYNTGKLPTPDVFQAAATQFTGAVGLFYTLLLTQKHYSPGKAPEKESPEDGHKS
jgi:hypothetical protein